MHDDYLNDNVVIPEDIQKMTSDELQKAISAMEAELKSRKAAS